MSSLMDQDRTTSEPVTPLRPRSRRRLRTAQDLRQRRRRIVTYVLLIGSFILMVNALVGENGYLASLRSQRDHDNLVESLARLRHENQQYLDQVHQLKTDPAALEEAARRVLGFVRPGETVVIIHDTRPAPGPPQ